MTIHREAEVVKLDASACSLHSLNPSLPSRALYRIGHVSEANKESPNLIISYENYVGGRPVGNSSRTYLFLRKENPGERKRKGTESGPPGRSMLFQH